MDPLLAADVEKCSTYSLQGQTRLPLSDIPKVLNVTGNREGIWKRVPRACVGTDVVMEEAMGTKRTTRQTAGQFELQKRRKAISKMGNEINMILAEAGSQPCQQP